MKPEETIESRQIYQGRILNLRVDTVSLPKGGQAEREVVEHTASVVIVAVDSEGQVMLVRQFRKPTEEFLLEAPAGTLEEGESHKACALRELEEETGISAGSIRLMGGFWMTPGFCTEYMYAYLATQLQPGVSNQDDDEDIEVVRVPVEEVTHKIRSGEVRDAKSIAALLMALCLFEDELKLSEG